MIKKIIDNLDRFVDEAGDIGMSVYFYQICSIVLVVELCFSKSHENLQTCTSKIVHDFTNKRLQNIHIGFLWN